MSAKFQAVAVLAATLSMAFASGAIAQVDVRNLANSCAICHGTDGKPPRHGLDRLAGMNKSDFIGEMRDYKKQPKNSHLMGYVALGFSDTEIQAMADYFSKLPSAKKGSVR